jgi:hypothetical protein
MALGLAGWMKLSNIQTFAAQISEFSPDSRWVPLVAVGLPFIELATALAMLATPRTGSAVLLAAMLTGGFVLVLGWVVITGSTFECGCFGEHDPLAGNPPLALTRAAGLFGTTIALYVDSLRTALKCESAH